MPDNLGQAVIKVITQFEDKDAQNQVNAFFDKLSERLAAASNKAKSNPILSNLIDSDGTIREIEQVVKEVTGIGQAGEKAITTVSNAMGTFKGVSSDAAGQIGTDLQGVLKQFLGIKSEIEIVTARAFDLIDPIFKYRKTLEGINEVYDKQIGKVGTLKNAITTLQIGATQISRPVTDEDIEAARQSQTRSNARQAIKAGNEADQQEFNNRNNPLPLNRNPREVKDLQEIQQLSLDAAREYREEVARLNPNDELLPLSLIHI